MNSKLNQALATFITCVMVISLASCNAENKGESETFLKNESVEISENETVEATETKPVVTETEQDSETETVSRQETDETSETKTDAVTETETETVTETETEAETETAIETEEEIVELIYGYDFENNSWTELFDIAGSASRSVTADPMGSENAVLSIAHGAGQKASYVRNKNSFEIAESAKVVIGVDLYIPSSSLANTEDYVQMQINGAYDHHINLRSDSASQNTPFDTKDFPRDKWFTVRFSFDMEKMRYDVEVVEDGAVRTVVFAGRSANSLKETGPMNLRVYLGGENQIIYIDHMGLVTTGSGTVAEIEKIEKGVSFIRIDGVNAAGEILKVYGDFSGGVCADDLGDLVWEKSDSYSGEYSAVAGADGLTHIPENGGYYLRVRAKYGNKSLVSYPLYIRDEMTNNFVNGYLSLNAGKLSAAVVYNNEGEVLEAKVKVIVFDGTKEVKTYTESLAIRSGSDLAVFDLDSLNGDRAEMTVIVGDNLLCSAESMSGLPYASVDKTSKGTSVLLNGEKIADFESNRYMRFRATLENDHWIGTEHNPIDMGFAYQEAGVAGLVNSSVEFVSAPGAFKITFFGQKLGLKTTQQNELIGFYDAEKKEFTYIYNASMTSDTSVWHKNSSWAASSRIEPFDYHLERMSILDRVYNNNGGGDLYDYVIYENGDELVRIPKLPIPRYMISGKYYYGFFLSPGESVCYPDAADGGWKSTVLSDSGDTYVEICWSWYDMHSCSENSVPRVGAEDNFTVSQSWLFATTDAKHDKALIDKAVEVEWQDLPNYQLPLFSTNNTFETRFGGTDWQYAWWKSSYDCTMDAEVGHDGAGSVKIEKTSSGEASWYTEGVWGFPYSFDQVQGKTYKVSGYIKTENVQGEAYIANIQYQHATPDDNTVTRTVGLSGTNDWTYVSFTFAGQEREKADGSIQRCIDHFFLTLDGTGTVWFDDVKIEAVE